MKTVRGFLKELIGQSREGYAEGYHGHSTPLLKTSPRERSHSGERRFPYDYESGEMPFKKVNHVLTFLTMRVVT